MRAADVSDWSMKIGHVGILNDLLAGLEIPEDNRRDVMRLLDKGTLLDWVPRFFRCCASGGLRISLVAVMSFQRLAPC